MDPQCLQNERIKKINKNKLKILSIWAGYEPLMIVGCLGLMTTARDVQYCT
jgi:hypothetical protein